MSVTHLNLSAIFLGLMLTHSPVAKAEPPPGATASATSAPAKVAQAPVRTIHLMVTLAWEGRDLSVYNQQAWAAFRERFPGLQIMHLVSPAYFTKPAVDQAAVRTTLRQAMRPKDQFGLLLGNWQSLANASGVIFRSSPTFWGSEVKADDCRSDCGLEVPVNIYPADELDKMLQTSVHILAAQGFGRPSALAFEGWVASSDILEAAYRAGMRYDLSAVSPEMIGAKTRDYPIYQWAKSLWPRITPHSQPYQIQLAKGAMTELPQSLAAVDYLVQSDILDIFKEYVERVQRDPQTPLVFPLQVYQETAYMTLPALATTLQAVFAYAQKAGVALTSLQLPDLELPEDRLLSGATPIAH